VTLRILPVKENVSWEVFIAKPSSANERYTARVS
jgi:hypothetical protein